MYKLLILLLIGCKFQMPFNLYCEIPNGISFKDNASIYFNKREIGSLTIEEKREEKMIGKVTLQKNIKIPRNSVLVFAENPVGPSHFELKMGDSDSLLNINDYIRFLVKKTESNFSDSLNKQMPDLKKNKSPIIVRGSNGHR